MPCTPVKHTDMGEPEGAPIAWRSSVFSLPASHMLALERLLRILRVDHIDANAAALLVRCHRQRSIGSNLNTNLALTSTKALWLQGMLGATPVPGVWRCWGPGRQYAQACCPFPTSTLCCWTCLVSASRCLCTHDFATHGLTSAYAGALQTACRLLTLRGQCCLFPAVKAAVEQQCHRRFTVSGQRCCP